jgi:hypothetical protein
VTISLKRPTGAQQIAGRMRFVAFEQATTLMREVIHMNGGSVLCG